MIRVEKLKNGLGECQVILVAEESIHLLSCLLFKKKYKMKVKEKKISIKNKIYFP